MAKVIERFKFATTLFTCNENNRANFLDDIMSIDRPVMVLSCDEVAGRCCPEENQMTYKVVLEVTAVNEERAKEILSLFVDDANGQFGEDNDADLAGYFNE